MAPQSTKDRILDEATRLFVAQGYQASTVRQIAGAVGIQSGSLFHHFSDKPQILEACMRRTVKQSLERIEAARVAHTGDQQYSVLDRLIACELNDVVGHRRQAMALLLFAWNDLHEEARESILELRNAYEAVWMGVLIGLFDGHLLAAHISRKTIAGAIAWTQSWFKTGQIEIDDLVVCMRQGGLAAGQAAVDQVS